MTEQIEIEEALDKLLTSFDKAVRALGDAGHDDEACKLTARAWADTHNVSRRADRRLTATLHYLALPEYSGRQRKVDTDANTTPTKGTK